MGCNTPEMPVKLISLPWSPLIEYSKYKSTLAATKSTGTRTCLYRRRIALAFLTLQRADQKKGKKKESAQYKSEQTPYHSTSWWFFDNPIFLSYLFLSLLSPTPEVPNISNSYSSGKYPNCRGLFVIYTRFLRVSVIHTWVCCANERGLPVCVGTLPARTPSGNGSEPRPGTRANPVRERERTPSGNESEPRPGTGANPVRERERTPSVNGSECRVVHVSRPRWPVTNRHKRDFKRSIDCTTQGHRSFVALSLRRWFLTTKHTLFFSSWYEFRTVMLSFLFCS